MSEPSPTRSYHFHPQAGVELIEETERPGVFPPSIEEQAERALRNVEAILVAAGSGLDRLVSVTIYVADISLWGRVNAKYAEILGAHRPARAVVPTLPLHHGALIEISAIGALEGS